MPLYDQHLHSWHSMDCRTDPAANVESAIARGLAGLTFTEHFDTRADDWSECIYDDDAYSATIRQLRERYGDAIFVGKGIEICYQPDRMDFILDFLRRHSFDMVMLSVHYFGARAVHRRENWAGVDLATGTQLYLETVLDAARCCAKLKKTHGRVFDVLGHLDLVKRYTQRFFGAHDASACGDLLDRILEACLEADLVPEINTSSLRQGVGETMPGSDAVARYARWGGTSMSLGSDAHRAEDVGAGFDCAVNLLRAVGIDRISHYRHQERIERGFESP